MLSFLSLSLRPRSLILALGTALSSRLQGTPDMYLVAVPVRLLAKRSRRVVVVPVVVLEMAREARRAAWTSVHAHTHTNTYVRVSAESHPRLGRWSIYLAPRGRQDDRLLSCRDTLPVSVIDNGRAARAPASGRHAPIVPTSVGATSLARSCKWQCRWHLAFARGNEY